MACLQAASSPRRSSFSSVDDLFQALDDCAAVLDSPDHHATNLHESFVATGAFDETIDETFVSALMQQATESEAELQLAPSFARGIDAQRRHSLGSNFETLDRPNDRRLSMPPMHDGVRKEHSRASVATHTSLGPAGPAAGARFTRTRARAYTPLLSRLQSLLATLCRRLPASMRPRANIGIRRSGTAHPTRLRPRRSCVVAPHSAVFFQQACRACTRTAPSVFDSTWALPGFVAKALPAIDGLTVWIHLKCFGGVPVSLYPVLARRSSPDADSAHLSADDARKTFGKSLCGKRVQIQYYRGFGEREKQPVTHHLFICALPDPF